MATDTTRKDDILDQLTAGIAELTTSAAWQTWLDVQRRFHGYSFSNTILIRRQYPDATRIAGFKAWRALGRSVRKGEKAIWILAPMRQRLEVEEPTEENEAAERPASVITGFRPVPVFDLLSRLSHIG